MTDERIVQLLTEIRDGQREAAAFAKAQAQHVEQMIQRQLANQEIAIKSQLATAKIYRRFTFGLVPILVVALGYVLWKLVTYT